MLSKNLFDEKTLEVNFISDYLTVTTPLPQYLPYARFLLDTDLSHTAKLLYTLLLDRATLSQKNNWMDERGFVYVIFPLSSLSDALRCSTMSIKRALRSLEDADLIERRRGRITVPNSIFVKVPTVQKCSPAWNDFVPSDGTEMISSMEQKCSTNQRYKNNLKDSHLIKTTAAPLTFGEYHNVFLTEKEYKQLKADFFGLDSLIEQLSAYIQSTGKKYADHAIKEKIGSAVDTSELEQQADAIKAQLRQRLSTKSRLEHQMDTLDFNDPYYDRKSLDLQRRYDEQYELIEDMETQLAEIQGQVDDIHQEKITADNIYHLLLAFDEVYNAATEVEQKEFIRAFIEHIDIFPEKQPDGNWIRNIVFAFPVPYNGKEIREFPLESQSTVECVLLMSKVQ